MSGIDKWVHFFEDASEKRDTESWWSGIKEKVLIHGMRVKGLVSDRASGLVKLGKPEYLDVASVADLFHYSQDMGKVLGIRIGSLLSRKQKKLKQANLKEEEKKRLKSELEPLLDGHKKYREEIETINKTVHPFDESDELKSSRKIEKELTKGFVRMGQLARTLDIDIDLQRSVKILNQIPDLAAGVKSWRKWLEESVEKLLSQEPVERKEQLKNWIMGCLMPLAYWQVHLPKTQARAKNKELRQYYKNRKQQALSNFDEHEFTASLSGQQKQEYMGWAMDMARKFQRSSSRVEGRNGYLAFMHHAHKGIPPKRLKVLTVVHNHDTRAVDGQTSAERLFKKKLPDLFEFILEDVTQFPEARASKANPLIISTVQH